MTPEFSVVIPTHDRLHLLQRAVASVQMQTFCNYELIVVDDGSTDGTREYLHSLIPPIKTFRQNNGGPGAARNLGARHASGRYLAFLDSDDLWFPWTLRVYANVARRTGALVFMAGKPHRFRAESALTEVREDVVHWHEFVDYLESSDQWRWWGASSFVVRRSTFTQTGGFSTKLTNGEDADLALRIGTAGRFAQITSPFTFAYREHSGNIALDLNRNLQAAEYAICAEHAGVYPGGKARELQRWRILTRHVRPVALECARVGLARKAGALYWATCRWHVALRRWQFLSALPVLAMLGLAKRKLSSLQMRRS